MLYESSEARRYAASCLPLAPSLRKRQSDSLFRPPSAPSFERKKGRLDEKINYYGQHITVSEKQAEFLEQDRRREAAQERGDRRHIKYVGMDIASIPDLFTNEPSDPTFEKACRNLRLGALREAYKDLSGEERKLLCWYYYHEYTMEEIGEKLGVSKMAVSKRLQKILNRLRSLM